MFKSIRKRDGGVVPFDQEKIISAIARAGAATGEFGHDRARNIAEKVVRVANEEIKTRIPSVEQIQDIVERVLMESAFKQTAKSYIEYRTERNRIREMKSRLMRSCHIISGADASEDSDIKRGNANVNGNCAMGKMLQFGEESSKEYTRLCLLRPEHAYAHDYGDIYIHDLDFYATGTLTCCQTDPLKLFKNGFNTGHGFLRTPNSINTAAALAAIILQANQNEQHGGQSIPNFDYAMAPSVNRSYYKALKQNLAKFEDFTEQSLDIEIPEDITLGDDEKLNKLKVPAKVIDESKKDVENQTRQAMEAFIHNLNTMHSRAGAQVPFTSINFGTDITPEGRLVSKWLLEATMSGLGHHETPIFPISIFKVKEGVNYNPEDPNYDLFRRSMEVSSKRLFPNFVFIDAPFNLQYYKSGDYETEIATMGCRTRVMSSIFPESDGRPVSRGNLSFTSINLPRIGIKHGICGDDGRKEPDWSGFYRELDEKINLAAAQLMERYEFQAAQKVKNFPFLMGQGNWLGSEQLDPEDEVREVIKHGSLGIGFIGLANALVAMIGKHHGESAEAQELGLDIVSHMRERCDELSRRHKLNFSLLATPAESLAGKIIRLDKKEFGEIPGVTDRDYYTNSFHVPVYYNISAFDKIDIEAPYHNLTNGGHITYVEMDGDPSNNIEAFEAVIRHMKEQGIGYGSINHPVDSDPVCGFSGIIEGNTCPSCGRDEHDGPCGFERLRRITGYLVGSLERWNDGKRAEEHDRVKHGVAAGFEKTDDSDEVAGDSEYSAEAKVKREAKKNSAKKATGKE